MQATIKVFCESFGIDENEMPERAKKIINEVDFSYRVLDGRELEDAILSQIKRMEVDKQKIAAPERTDAWEKGWNENLVEFVESGYDLNQLIPKFYRKDIPLRLNGNFIRSDNDRFEYDFFRVARAWLFSNYLADIDSVYEFGCGTGYNLVELADMYPDKKIYGLDFVPSVVELLKEIKAHHKNNIDGKLFNMIYPDFDMEIDENAAFYTFGAIEQLGGQIQDIFRFFIEKRPKIVFHLEPTVELYDEERLIDYLAIKFHKQRGYTEGMLPLIQKMEEEGKAEIIKAKRLYLGNYNMEGYTCIIWRPIYNKR